VVAGAPEAARAGVAPRADGEPLLLLGCGIFRHEVRYLIEKNGWDVEGRFLGSALHVDLHKLSRSLTQSLDHFAGRDKVVFYGACHPGMDGVLASAGTFRTAGQNCVEMLLGPARYEAELERGSFFVLEDWARTWEAMVTATFGPNWKVIREIYQAEHRHLLCLRTPCSSDFTAAAEEAGRLVGLPLLWADVSLDHLESTLGDALSRRRAERAAQAASGASR
jgi:hypothetical protein